MNASDPGSFLVNSTDAVGTTYSITGLPFNPTADGAAFVFLWWNGRSDTTDAIGAASSRRGYGAALGTSARLAVTSRSLNNVGTSDAESGQSDQCCACIVNGTPAFAGKLDFDAWLSDGARFIVDQQFALDVRVHYLILGLTNAAPFSITEPGAAGDVSVTGLSFQPACALFLHASGATAAEQASNDARIMFGAASGSGAAQGVWLGGSNNAAPNMQTISYCRDEECIAEADATVATINGRASLKQFNADGLTVTYAERSAARVVLGVALADANGGQFAVAGGTTQTDTTTPIDMPGAGSIGTLIAGVVLSHGKAESTSDTPQDHDEWSLGAFSSASERRALAALDEDATANSEVTTAVEYDAVYANLSTASAIEGLMDVADMSAKTYIMDDADPSAAFFFNVLFGTAAAAAGASNRRTLLGVGA